MLKSKPLELGVLKGTILDFSEVNDVLPMHSHGDADIHISVVARGSFLVHGNGWKRIVQSGDVLDWNAHDPHEFVALEAESRVVNIIKA